MSNKGSQLKIGILLSYINLGVGNLIPIFYTPIMLSLMGQNEYGLYKLAGSVTSYLGLISLGIGSAITRYLIKANVDGGKEAEQNVLGLFVIIFRIIAALVLLVGFVLSTQLHRWYGASLSVEELQKMRLIVLILTCNTAINMALSPYVTVVTAHERFLFMQCANILSTCVIPIVNLIVLFCGYKSVGIALSSLAVNVVIQFIYYCYVRIKMDIRAHYKKMPINLLKEIIIFSFWIFVANVVGQLYNATDTVMIGSVAALGTIGVAVYNVGGTFNGIMFSLTTGISSLLTPKTNKMVFEGANQTELTDLAIRIGRIQGYIITLVVTGFIAFGRPFIHFYVGDDYMDAYWVALLIMIPNVIPLVQSVCLSIIVAQNKHRFRAVLYLGIAILNVIGTWYLIHTPLGIVGAALMTGAALLLGHGVVMNWYYWKKSRIEIWRFWKELVVIFLIPVLMCALAVLCGKFVNYYKFGILLLSIVIYTIIYVIISWIFTMNQYEKNLFRKPINQIIRKIKMTNN